MKLRSLLFSAACAVALGICFTSCDDDDNDDDNGGGSTPFESVAYLLQEGNKGDNNATIALLQRDEKGEMLSDGEYYETTNGKKLGDLGHDMITYEGRIYVTVSGSRYIAKLDKNCKELARYSFEESEGDPRRIAAHDGKLYVTLYSGQVARLDTASLAKEDILPIAESGVCLEGIAVRDNDIYVANTYLATTWEYLNTVTVIDAATFTIKDKIETVINPEVLLASGNNVFLISRGDYFLVPNMLQRIMPDGSTDTIAVASKMVVADKKMYLINSETVYSEDFNTSETTNTFFTYSLDTNELSNESFLSDIPQELQSDIIYLLEIDPKNADIYIGTTDYKNTGTIYRFTAGGKLLESFDSEGLNPSKMLFLE